MHRCKWKKILVIIFQTRPGPAVSFACATLGGAVVPGVGCWLANNRPRSQPESLVPSLLLNQLVLLIVGRLLLQLVGTILLDYRQGLFGEGTSHATMSAEGRSHHCVTFVSSLTDRLRFVSVPLLAFCCSAGCRIALRVGAGDFHPASPSALAGGATDLRSVFALCVRSGVIPCLRFV